MKIKVKLILLIIFSINQNLFSKEDTISLYKDSTSVYYGFGKVAKTTSSGIYKGGNISFRITLYDNNGNGVFSELKSDYIILSMPFEKELRFQDGVSFKKLEQAFYIEAEDKQFKINKIDSLGEYIIIEEIKSSTDENVVKLVNKIPDIEFKMLDGTYKNFKDFVDGENYIFVEFWGLWCEGCIKAVPKYSEVYEKHKDKLKIIYLNSPAGKRLKGLDLSENLISIKTFIEKHDLSDWIHGISSEEIEKEFLLNGYPYGVLFDKKGNVIKFKCTPKELEKFMNVLE